MFRQCSGGEMSRLKTVPATKFFRNSAGILRRRDCRFVIGEVLFFANPNTKRQTTSGLGEDFFGEAVDAFFGVVAEGILALGFEEPGEAGAGLSLLFELLGGLEALDK
jgi:hypothetical protein